LVGLQATKITESKTMEFRFETSAFDTSVVKLTRCSPGFFLGTSSLVSFKPYLDRLQKYLNNQYYVVFQAVPANARKHCFQHVPECRAIDIPVD
jgi:hypothetical protein